MSENNQNSNLPQYLNVIDNATVLAWLRHKSKSETMLIISLLGNNLQNFQKLYDEAPIQDGNNPNIHYWNVNYQSIAYRLVCDKNTGNTSYYVQYNQHNGSHSIAQSFLNDTQFGTYIISFFEYLLENKMWRNLA